MLGRHPLLKLAAIYVGGVIGALIRVGLTVAFPHEVDTWPWPTFAVNMAGAFMIGALFKLLADRPPEELHHPFLATGICGTLTTFATMQLELFHMVEGGEYLLASAYATASLTLGYVALRLGMVSTRSRRRVAP